MESEEELGFRTMGFGRTAGQDLLTAEPQSEGLPETDVGDMVLKNPPAGSSPCKLLWEILKDKRWGRLANCLGRVPARLLKDKSTFCRLLSFPISAGMGPLRLFCDMILHDSITKENEKES